MAATVHWSSTLLRCLAALGASWLVGLWARDAAAQPAQPSCGDGQVELAGSFEATWVDAISRGCIRLRELPDRDRSAKLYLDPEPTGHGVRVRLELSDGRKAVRVARVPEELARVMEALITLPPPLTAPLEPPAPEVPPPPATSAMVVRTTARSTDAAAKPKSSPIPLGFDLALLATGRALGPAAHLGVGLVASGDLDIDHGWIVGARARADVANFDVGGSGDLDGVAFGGGLELARRIRVAKIAAVDLGLGADALVDVPVDGHRNHHGSQDPEGDLRTRAFAKIWIPGNRISFSGLLGFELSPVHIGDENAGSAIGGELGVGVGWGAQ